MHSSMLKHQAKLQEWAMTVQECRTSGLPVRRWCREKGITAATDYRWEQELLSVSSNADGEESTAAFTELPAPMRLYRNISEGSTTLQVGDGGITIHQKLTPKLANVRNAPPKTALGKALTYLREQWPYLTNYLKDSRLERSNNRAERSIKLFVMDRKNFLLANTPSSARGSAVIFTLIQTAIENGLGPYCYLILLMKTTNCADLNDPGVT